MGAIRRSQTVSLSHHYRATASCTCSLREQFFSSKSATTINSSHIAIVAFNFVSDTCSFFPASGPSTSNESIRSLLKATEDVYATHIPARKVRMPSTAIHTSYNCRNAISNKDEPCELANMWEIQWV